jgi:two-component sensor histidine kinase
MEKETLLKELYHRTKNNMQVISSLLDLQALTINNPLVNDFCFETKNRIQAMALVHNKLYEANDLSSINLKTYIEDLMKSLMASYQISKNIHIAYEMEDIYVLIDIAIPCGLIINELITNIYKHAFPENKEGHINIILRNEEDNKIIISISDNGVGLPPDFNLEDDSRLGLKNVISLCEYQLDGKVSYKSTNGLSFQLSINKDIFKKRV